MARLNVEDKTIFCYDNLDILRGINSACVDLMYLDPPFNKNRKFSAPLGSDAAGQSFIDIFREKDVKDEWLDDIKQDEPELYKYLKSTERQSKGSANYDYCYLCYMSIRLIEMERILKNTGSIYLHCDSTMSHYLKQVMDIIFGRANFKREIIWNLQTASGFKSQVNGYVRGHDVILYYTKSDIFTFNKEFAPHKEEYIARFKKDDGDGRKYRDDRNNGRKQYLDETKGVMLTDVWSDIMSFQQAATSSEFTAWDTQKPLKLLERIIKASSNKGDIVLDSFCGCSTTCVAAETLGRKWIGIDKDPMVHKIVIDRLNKEIQGETNGNAKGDLLKDWDKSVIKSNTPPVRTDSGKDPRKKKYVYVISNPQYPKEYKVGVASDVKKRLASYQTSDPNRGYKEEFSLLTPYFNEIEDKIHNHKKFRAKHEWVMGDLKAIIKEIELLHKKGNKGSLI